MMATMTGVDEYLATVPSQARPGLDELRAAIVATLPNATETISYKILAYRQDGKMVVWCAGFKDHLSLFPASAAVREALGSTLEPYLSGKGTIRFELNRKLPVTMVKKIVRLRVKENAGVAR
jgi:uncharacterized protein YdhG (YjbR/CyaY superfamily)